MPFAEHESTLRHAIVEVAEASFFAFTGPLDAAGFAAMAGPPGASADRGGAAWYAMTVGFSGDLHGAIDVAVPETLAASLVGGFLGLDPSEPAAPDALRDGMGELANMICGTWLTRACRDGHFDLSPPAVTRVQGTPPYDAASRAAPDVDVYMLVNELPLRVLVRAA